MCSYLDGVFMLKNGITQTLRLDTANGVNDAGQVVGGDAYQGFLWTP